MVVVLGKIEDREIRKNCAAVMRAAARKMQTQSRGLARVNRVVFWQRQPIAIVVVRIAPLGGSRLEKLAVWEYACQLGLRSRVEPWAPATRIRGTTWMDMRLCSAVLRMVGFLCMLACLLLWLPSDRMCR